MEFFDKPNEITKRLSRQLTVMEGERLEQPAVANGQEATAYIQLHRDELKQEAAKLWLQGNSAAHIRKELSIDFQELLAMLHEMRQELREAQRAELLDIVAERVEGFRLIQATAWAKIDDDARGTGQYLSVILRASEDIGKLQGVLSDSVKHDVTHHVKLYDFRDNYPDAIPADYQVVPRTETLVPAEPVEAMANSAIDDVEEWARKFME